MSAPKSPQQFRLLPLFHLGNPINDSEVTFKNPSAAEPTEDNGTQDAYTLGKWDFYREFLDKEPPAHTNRLVFWGDTTLGSKKGELFMREVENRMVAIAKLCFLEGDESLNVDLGFALANWVTCAAENESIRGILNHLVTNSVASTEGISSFAENSEITQLKEAAQKFQDHLMLKNATYTEYRKIMQLAEEYDCDPNRIGFLAMAAMRDSINILDTLIAKRKGSSQQQETPEVLDQDVVPLALGALAAQATKDKRERVRAYADLQLPTASLEAKRNLLVKFAFADRCEELVGEKLQFIVDQYQAIQSAHPDKDVMGPMLEPLAYLAYETPFAANALIWLADHGVKHAEMLLHQVPYDLEIFRGYVATAATALMKVIESGETDMEVMSKSLVPVLVLKKLVDYRIPGAGIFFQTLIDILYEGVAQGDTGIMTVCDYFYREGIIEP